MLRSRLRRLRAEARLLLGQAARARARLDGSQAVVLMYHRVLPAERAAAWAVEPGMYVTPESFDRHLDLLQAEFRPLPLGEILAALESGRPRPLPRGACAISFDDGWRDNHDHALPALRRRGIPATVFVVTERVGTRGPFWPDEVARALAAAGPEQRSRLAEALPELPLGGPRPLEALLDALKAMAEDRRQAHLARIREWAEPPTEPAERELMTWEELEALREGGFEVEAHGLSHAILTGLPAEQAEREIRLSGEQLRERGFGAARLFAYPCGAENRAVRRQVREAGYRAALTTEPGLVGAAQDPLRWPRLALHEDVSASAAEFLERVPGGALPSGSGAR